MSVAHQDNTSKRWRGKPARMLAALLAVAAIAWPLAVGGQTYRQKLGPRSPAPADGLPGRLATRPERLDANQPQGRGGEPAPAAGSKTPAEGSDGQRLVAEAARRVFEIPSLHTRLRMRFSSPGGQVVASGEYLQLGAGAEKLLRLDLKIPIGSKIGTVQEIRSRDYLWLIRDLPPDPPLIERVGLRQARIAIARGEEAQRMSPLAGWMLLGGLSRLLTSLDANFEFSAPQPATLAGMPVLVVRGRWRREALMRLTGAKREANVPEQLPHEVELALAEPSADPPLFPYRIEYLRHNDDAQSPKNGRGTPLTVIEFFEVRRPGSLEPALFEFDPEERESDDITMAYLRRLGIVPAKSP